MNIIEFFIKQTKVMNLLIAVIIGYGIYIFITGQKEAFPAFTVNQISITTVYPGASAKTVEKFVTFPIENNIKNITGVKKINSITRENISIINAVISTDYENKIQDIRNEIKSRIDEIIFPEDTQNSKILIFDNGRIPAVRVLISGGFDERQLRSIVDRFTSEAESLKDISGLELAGYRDEEILVECYPDKLKNRGITINDVINSIRSKNINIPGGEIYKDDKVYLIRIQEEFSTIDDVNNIIIRANEDFKSVQIKDVAQVYNGFKSAETYYRVNGIKGIEIQVLKSKSGDSLKVSKNIRNLVEKYKKDYPDFQFIINNDTAVFVKNRLNVLSNNAFMGLIFVILALFLFFDLATSFWTVLGMPVAFCTAIIVIDAFGISLNLMSMFGFIIVVGMIVDDAIVVAENIYQKIEQGKDKVEAAISGTREVILPVMASIATTIAAFLPLMFISGTLGKFFGVIPKVVAVTLAASFVECIFILPGHIAHYNERRINPRKKIIFSKVQTVYKNFVTFFLEHKLITISGFILLGFIIVFLSFVYPRIPFQFFPGRVDEFDIDIELDQSFSLDMTEDAIITFENHLLKNMPENIQDIIITIGQEGIGQFVTKGDNKAEIRILLDPERPDNFNEDAFKNKIIQASSLINKMQTFEINVVQNGPPRGKAINVIIVGQNLNNTLAAANIIRDYTSSLSNTSDIRLDYIEGKSELIVDVDELKASAAGLSPAEIGSAVRNAFGGSIASKIKDQGKDIDIRVKFDAVSSATTATFNKLNIPNRFGKNINFNQVADLKIMKSVSEIRHYNSRPAITVMGNLKDRKHKKYTAVYLNKIIKNKFSSRMKDFPDIEIIYSGEDEDVQQTMRDIIKAYLISFFIIIILLLGLFKRYTHVMIILFTVPFGMLGVFAGLLLNNMAFSYTSMIGMVALSGVVVNDAIILIDFINSRIASGLEVKEAVIQASVQRLRPIIITTLTTVFGLLPMAYGWGGREEFLEPMGIALVYGLIFATFLTLLLIPVIYYIVEYSSRRKFISRLMHVALKKK